jgi:predicted  nucleic acid-binding Zn-ribbon protein
MVTVKQLNAALATSLNPIYGALHDMKDKITEVETRLTEKFSSRVEGLKDRIKVLEASIKDSEMTIPEEIALIDKKHRNVVILEFL